MRTMTLAATFAAFFVLTTVPAHAALVRGTGNSDVLFGHDDDNVNDPEIQPAGVTAKRPFGLYVHGRYDTTGAVRSVLSITGALGWKQAAALLEILGDVDDSAKEAAYELGATIAAQLMTE